MWRRFSFFLLVVGGRTRVPGVRTAGETTVGRGASQTINRCHRWLWWVTNRGCSLLPLQPSQSLTCTMSVTLPEGSKQAIKTKSSTQALVQSAWQVHYSRESMTKRRDHDAYNCPYKIGHGGFLPHEETHDWPCFPLRHSWVLIRAHEDF